MPLTTASHNSRIQRERRHSYFNALMSLKFQLVLSKRGCRISSSTTPSISLFQSCSLWGRSGEQESGVRMTVHNCQLSVCTLKHSFPETSTLLLCLASKNTHIIVLQIMIYRPPYRKILFASPPTYFLVIFSSDGDQTVHSSIETRKILFMSEREFFSVKS